MKQFIYKTLIAIVAIVLVYELTIGKQIKEFTSQSEILMTKEGRKDGINKIREELKKAVKKERYLSREDARLINQFIQKIKKEIKESSN
tara:strand:- start:272 stop:538 length:267 start_codon:yes stop_codon:yes gene_type:complete